MHEMHSVFEPEERYRGLACLLTQVGDWGKAQTKDFHNLDYSDDRIDCWAALGETKGMVAAKTVDAQHLTNLGIPFWKNYRFVATWF